MGQLKSWYLEHYGTVTASNHISQKLETPEKGRRWSTNPKLQLVFSAKVTDSILKKTKTRAPLYEEWIADSSLSKTLNH